MPRVCSAIKRGYGAAAADVGRCAVLSSAQQHSVQCLPARFGRLWGSFGAGCLHLVCSLAVLWLATGVALGGRACFFVVGCMRLSACVLAATGVLCFLHGASCCSAVCVEQQQRFRLCACLQD